MSQPQNKSLAAIVSALIASLIAAITTHRSDTTALAKQKAESDAKIQELQDRIHELEENGADVKEVEQLRAQIEDALVQAQAAKPPTDEQIAEVEKIEPAAPPAETTVETGKDTGE